MIKELKQKGWTLTAIAEETGYDRKTIRKYLNQEKLPQAAKRKSRGSKLDPYKSYILARIKEGTINCAVLLEEIQKLGYEGKSTILREFVQPYRAAPKKQATVRYETKPGEQAQVDWAENAGTCIIDGEEIQLYAFIMILSYSRKRYIEFTTDMKQDTLIKCHLNAFSYFNGVPQQILYDNMRTVVTKHRIGYFRQMSYQYTRDETVLEFLKNRSEYDERFLRSVLHSMLFVGIDILKSVKSLSGGEAIRLQLCQLFLGEYNILLLDEPTNFLDIYAIEALERFITAYKDTIIFVSHDRRFIDCVADCIYFIEDQQLKLRG